jgi:ribonuclease HI
MPYTKLAGAGSLVIINKGRICFPRSEPIEDRIEIRHYPDITSMMSSRGSGGHTDEEMEYVGLLCGLMVVLEHVRNTRSIHSCGDNAACPWAIDVQLHVQGDSKSVISQMQISQMQGSSTLPEGARELNRRCTKLLDDILTAADSLEVTLCSDNTSEHIDVVDRLVNEAMDEKRSGYTVHSNAAPHLYGHS